MVRVCSRNTVKDICNTAKTAANQVNTQENKHVHDNDDNVPGRYTLKPLSLVLYLEEEEEDNK